MVDFSVIVKVRINCMQLLRLTLNLIRGGCKLSLSTLRADIWYLEKIAASKPPKSPALIQNRAFTPRLSRRHFRNNWGSPRKRRCVLFPLLDFHSPNRNAKLLGLVRGIQTRCGYFSLTEYVTVIPPASVVLRILANEVITVAWVGSFMIAHLLAFVLISESVEVEYLLGKQKIEKWYFVSH